MEDKLIWSSTGTEDWIFECDDKEDLIEQFIYSIDDERYEELLNEDIENIRNLAYDAYCDMRLCGDDFDYEDLVAYIIPMIEKQTSTRYERDYLWVVGNYQRWDGGHDSIGVYDDVEDGIKSICYPDYDATTKLYSDENNDVYFTESSHDAPMGGTEMYLYLYDDQMSDKAYELALQVEGYSLDEEYEEDYGYGIDWQDYVEDFEWVKLAIENNVLVPVKNNL